jgi:hypothetical protein
LQFSDDGILFSQRWEMEHLSITARDSSARYALYQADPEGSAVTTALAYQGVLVLVHHILPTKPLWFREGGFPLAWESGQPEISSGPDWTAARVHGRVTMVANLYGHDRLNQARPYGLDLQGTNVRYPFSAVPVLATRRTDAEPFTLVTLVAGRGSGVAPAQLRAAVTSVDVTAEPRVAIRYHDGVTASVEASAGTVSWSDW